jgi:hypothetical protein
MELNGLLDPLCPCGPPPIHHATPRAHGSPSPVSAIVVARVEAR